MSEAIDRYIQTHSKSQFVGFLLTFFFGPLGLFYSSWVAAIILIVIAFSTFATLVIPVLIWFLSIIISFFAVDKHNQKVKAAANLGVRET